MSYKIEYSPIAIRDLERVWLEVYNASQNLNITTQYIDSLMDKVESKADFPKSGAPLYYENTFTGYYFIVFKAYLIFYRVENTILYVDRVLYKKSDYIRKLNLDQ